MEGEGVPLFNSEQHTSPERETGPTLDVQRDTGSGRDRSRAWRLVIALVLVLLILSVPSTNLMLELGDDDGAPDDDIPDDYEGSVIISGDKTWTDEEKRLESPIVVRRGGHLKLKDCNLTVDLLDLVMGDRTWVTVEEGGKLTLEGTRLAIEYDPNLERAVLAYSRSRWTPPSVSRVVNLAGTDEPELSVELFWWHGRTPVTVAVQQEPGAELEFVQELGSTTSPKRVWTTYSVPLSKYKGAAVRVVIFPSDGNGTDDVFIGSARVVDGTSEPPYDRFETGRTWDDGWLCEVFRPFFTVMGRHYSKQNWEALIEAEGDISLSNSALEAPGNLSRWDHWYSTAKHQSEIVPKFLGSVSLYRARTTAGGHVKIEGADLEIDRSTVENVPIIASSSVLTISGSTMSSDGDILAINTSRGTIDSCDFIITDFAEIHPWGDAYSSDRRGVALAIAFNDSKGPVQVSDCSFSGASIAVELNHAWASVQHCLFSQCSWYGIWDHETRGIGSWDDINASNYFEEMEGDWYFRTHSAVIELMGPGRPPEGSVYSYDTGLISWEGVDPYDTQHLIVVDAYRARMLMPTLSVNSVGHALYLEYITLDVINDWGGANNVQVDTTIRSSNLTLDPEASYRDFGGGHRVLRCEQSRGEGPGWIDLHFKVGVPTEFIDSYAVVLRLDGGTEGVIHDEAFEPSRYSNYDGEANYSLNVGAGSHSLHIELVGFQEDGTYEVIEEETVRFFRMTDPASTSDAMEFLAAGKGTLLIGPGIAIEATDESLLSTSDDLHFRLYMSDGCAFSLENLSTPTTGSIRVRAYGPGSVSMRNLTTGTFELGAVDADTEIVDVECIGTSIGFHGGDHQINAIVIKHQLYFRADSNATVVLDSSKINGSRWYEVLGGSLSIRNTLLSSTSTFSPYIYAYDNCSVRIENSTFKQMQLEIYAARRGNVSLFVKGCEFIGPACHLWIQTYRFPDPETPTILEDSTISGNIFHGNGTGLLYDCSRYEWLQEDNRFESGSSIFYWSDFRPKLIGEMEDIEYFRLWVDPDENQLASIEEVLGREPDMWDGVFHELTGDPPTMEGPIPITYHIEAIGGGYSETWENWIVAFGELELPSDIEELPVPLWEDVMELVRTHLDTTGLA